MEPSEYHLTFELENDHWWHATLHRRVLAAVRKFSDRLSSLDILDAGCGTGGMAAQLSAYGRTWGVDISELALKLCSRRGLKDLKLASVDALPFPNDSFDGIACLDVLEHQRVSDVDGALREFHRVLRPTGFLILNVPAYAWLLGAHDRAVHNVRRFNRGQLALSLERTGYRIEYMTHWNTLLFPFLATWRKLKKGHQTDLYRHPWIINSALKSTLDMECRLNRHVALPFGLSLFCVARKTIPGKGALCAI